MDRFNRKTASAFNSRRTLSTFHFNSQLWSYSARYHNISTAAESVRHDHPLFLYLPAFQHLSPAIKYAKLAEGCAYNFSLPASLQRKMQSKSHLKPMSARLARQAPALHV